MHRHPCTAQIAAATRRDSNSRQRPREKINYFGGESNHSHYAGLGGRVNIFHQASRHGGKKDFQAQKFIFSPLCHTNSTDTENRAVKEQASWLWLKSCSVYLETMNVISWNSNISKYLIRATLIIKRAFPLCLQADGDPTGISPSLRAAQGQRASSGRARLCLWANSILAPPLLFVKYSKGWAEALGVSPVAFSLACESSP